MTANSWGSGLRAGPLSKQGRRSPLNRWSGGAGTSGADGSGVDGTYGGKKQSLGIKAQAEDRLECVELTVEIQALQWRVR